MKSTTRRRRGLIVLSLAGVVLCAAPWLLMWSDLPSTLSSGYSITWVEQSVSRIDAVVAVIAIAGLGVSGLIYAAFVTPRRDSAPPASSAAIGGFLLGLGVAVSFTTAWVNRSAAGRAGWQQVVGVVFVLVTALSFSVAGRWATRDDSVLAQADPTHPPRFTLAPGEQAVWAGTSTQPLLWIMTAALVLIGLAVAFTGEAAVGLLVVAIGLIIGGLFSRIRVLVDRSGLTVRYTPLSWPSTHVGLTEIEEASVIDVRPRRWGGWGYRGSLRAFGSAAVVVRGGPGLRLDLTKGRTFVVTVDHPEGAADLVAAELDRLRTAH